MANKFKRSTNLTGKFTDIIIVNGKFTDAETGEIVDVANICEKIYGDKPITIQTSYKSDEDVE